MAAILVDLETGKSTARIPLNEELSGVAFSPDSRRLVTTSWDGTARIADVKTGKEIARFIDRSPRSPVYAAAFSADGSRILTAEGDAARVWDATWLQRYGVDLVTSACKQKLRSASQLTGGDVGAAPVLAGREGDEVCVPRTHWRWPKLWRSMIRE
jgi:WD40 repeat protein